MYFSNYYSGEGFFTERNIMNQFEKLLAVLTVNEVSLQVFEDSDMNTVVDYLGGTDVLIYTGSSSDSFTQLVKSYRAAPSANSRRYKKLDFSEIDVWSSVKQEQVDNMMNNTQLEVVKTIESSTTRPPAEVWPPETPEEPPQTTTSEPEDPAYPGDDTPDDMPKSTWNPNSWN